MRIRKERFHCCSGFTKRFSGRIRCTIGRKYDFGRKWTDALIDQANEQVWTCAVKRAFSGIQKLQKNFYHKNCSFRIFAGDFVATGCSDRAPFDPSLAPELFTKYWLIAIKTIVFRHPRTPIQSVLNWLSRLTNVSYDLLVYDTFSLQIVFFCRFLWAAN